MDKWFIDVIKNQYIDFNGRASRQQYWMFFLWSVLFGLGSVLADIILNTFWINILLSLLVFLPSFAISVRRLHDHGKSGWWYLILLIPFLGVIYFIYLFVTRGQTGTNQYGRDPLVPINPNPEVSSAVT